MQPANEKITCFFEYARMHIVDAIYYEMVINCHADNWSFHVILGSTLDNIIHA